MNTFSPCETEAYGPQAPQRIDYFLPDAAAHQLGVIALVHGGFWRKQHDSSQMVPLARDLAQRGWVVANVEYRRSGCGGDWPHILDDVRAALRQIRQSPWVRDPAARLVSIGHSAGGQLALLASDLCDGVVALAPVTDVARAQREHLGEGAVQEFFGAEPENASEMYRQASPLNQLPLASPALVVHGDQDQRVPVEHAQAYVAAARAAGASAILLEVAGAEHFGMIDPMADHWDQVLRWMGGVVG